MRRTARLRALSVVLPALGITLGVAPPHAFAEPTAEVSPSSVQPGGSVTVSVSCDPGTGTPPATVDATSEAFETGTVRLQLVPGNDDKASGPAYSGTARIAADQELQEGRRRRRPGLRVDRRRHLPDRGPRSGPGLERHLHRHPRRRHRQQPPPLHRAAYRAPCRAEHRAPHRAPHRAEHRATLGAAHRAEHRELRHRGRPEAGPRR